MAFWVRFETQYYLAVPPSQLDLGIKILSLILPVLFAQLGSIVLFPSSGLHLCCSLCLEGSSLFLFLPLHPHLHQASLHL